MTDESTQCAQALARHVKAALLHLRQAEDIAERSGIDLYASKHDVPAAGLIRAAGEAVEDLDMWAIGNARAHGAAADETYAHTGRWCHAEGGALPAGSWPRADRLAEIAPAAEAEEAGDVPPETCAGGTRFPVAYVYLCSPCAGYAPMTEPDYSGALSGWCQGCGNPCREVHRFPATIEC